MSQTLHIQPFPLGDFQTNAYVVAHGGACWVIDPGYGPGAVIDAAKSTRANHVSIVLTHAHVDHIAGVAETRDAFPDCPILVHEAEAGFLRDPSLNLSIAIGEPVVAPEATQLLQHGDTLDLDGLSFHVRHTPGHSPGGVAFYQPDHKLVIAGDALFAGAIGRYDFPTSNGPQLFQSIREQLLTLPDDTQVLPGHGPATTVGHERLTNPYLTGDQPVVV
ncbi:MAG: MBL fold metallo-hydrolase [Planctomycetota bacterium]